VNSNPKPIRCFKEVHKKFVIFSYEALMKFVRKVEYHVKSFKMFVRSPKKFVILSYEAHETFVRNIGNSMPILLRCL
jgi:hypothetical protein